MSIFKINLEVEDLIDGLEGKTEKNINYIKENFSRIIESEEEFLENYVNGGDAINKLLTIRDNQGELIINNDDGEEIGVCGYYTDIII